MEDQKMVNCKGDPKLQTRSIIYSNFCESDIEGEEMRNMQSTPRISTLDAEEILKYTKTRKRIPGQITTAKAHWPESITMSGS